MANDKLLKVAAIYGANASGKSNVYDAFEYMTYYVDESFKFGDEEKRCRIMWRNILPLLDCCDGMRLLQKIISQGIMERFWHYSL